MTDPPLGDSGDRPRRLDSGATVSRVRRLLPGLGVLLALGLLARVIAASVPVGSHLVVVIGVGVLLANTVGVPDWASAGVGTYDRWLEALIETLRETIQEESTGEV